jgi:serine/threonine protein kinase
MDVGVVGGGRRARLLCGFGCWGSLDLFFLFFCFFSAILRSGKLPKAKIECSQFSRGPLFLCGFAGLRNGISGIFFAEPDNFGFFSVIYDATSWYKLYWKGHLPVVQTRKTVVIRIGIFFFLFFFFFSFLCSTQTTTCTFLSIETEQNAKKTRNVIEAGKKEVELLDEARHPNIVRVISSWESSKGYHVAMEYASRGDAFDIVDFYNGGCPEPLAGKVALGLFSALTHIHSKGIVHRDVKPENLFIKEDGDVVLGDFGLAGRRKNEEELLRTPCGTMTYRAPEVVRGERYGPGVDVWSAGLTIYTLLTGYDPWATSSGKMRCVWILA